VVNADITVSRPSTDPGSGDPSNANATPEPASAVLLAGLALGGLVTRRYRREPVTKTDRGATCVSRP
jgi:hypothetical protein